MTAFEIDAPASVEADQRSNVSVAWVIQNLGPDEVEVFYRVQMWSAPLCLSFTSFVGSEVMPVLAEVRREVVVPFTCSRSVDGTLPVTFVADGYAHDQSQINRDPNPYNNARETQAKVTLLGTAPLPTPGGPTEQPTNSPGDPTLAAGTPVTAPIVGGALPGAAGTASTTQAQAVRAARGLPVNGSSSAGEGPSWAPFLIAVIALGLPTAAGVCIHRLIARRP